MFMSNQRGRGNDPVVVLGKIKSAVAVNMSSSERHSTSPQARVKPSVEALSERFVGRGLSHDIYVAKS
jgi:hypothetical protein